MLSLLPWIAFLLLVVLLLALDLGVLNRRPHAFKAGEALGWTAFWIVLALAWNVGVYFMYEQHLWGIGQSIGHPLDGQQAAMQFFTAYVVEKTLSIDNLFVMALVFNYFAVPQAYQHRVLYLGIVGAVVFRGVFIGAGLAFVHLFTWAVYVFGALLIYSAAKLLVSEEGSLEPDKHPIVRLVRRFYPMTSEYHGDRFFVRVDGKRMATPLCVALVLIEASDIVFAVDSLPAVFGVTSDPFIAFTSNVFAILGLRALYFALAAVLHTFRYLKVSLVFVLGFVGVKMMLAHHYPIDTLVSLAVIMSLLTVGVVASLIAMRVAKREGEAASDAPGSPEAGTGSAPLASEAPAKRSGDALP